MQAISFRNLELESEDVERQRRGLEQEEKVEGTEGSIGEEASYVEGLEEEKAYARIC